MSGPRRNDMAPGERPGNEPDDDAGPFAPRQEEEWRRYEQPWYPDQAHDDARSGETFRARAFTGGQEPYGGHGEFGPPAGPPSSGPAGHGPSGPAGGGRGGRGGGGGRGPDGPGEGRRRQPRRRSLSALIGPLAGAIGLAILLAAGVYALADSRSACTGSDTVSLNVTVAPDIAPAVKEIVGTFNDERKTVNGRCVRATVRSANPVGTATLLAGQGSAPGETDPDVWIPDSSLWASEVRSTPKGASRMWLTPTSVAQTPVVLATSRSFSSRLRGEGVRPTWDMLLKATDALAAGAQTKNDVLPANSIHLQILDPIRNAGGLAAVVMTRTLLQGDPHATQIFAQITRNVQTSISPDTRALFASFKRDARGRAPVVIVPEQAVWAYNRARPSIPASAIYPAEGMLSLDYPFALTTGDATKVRAAGLLEKAMKTERAKTAVQALGFRTTEGRLGSTIGSTSGLSPRVPRSLPSPAPNDVADVLEAWNKLSLGTRMLTLIDVSGSMSEPVGQGVTRMQATARVATNGLSLLPANTDLGLWSFATKLRGDLDYRVEVPLGPVSTRLGSGTRRQAILNALTRLRPKPDGDTGLYDSVLAGVRSMQKSYAPDMYNSLLVLTDGKNDDAGGITLSALLKSLKKEYDQERPVQVFFIGFGPDVDMAAMEKIAQQTNGAAYHANRPQEIQKIFLDTVARRICTPPCKN